MNLSSRVGVDRLGRRGGTPRSAAFSPGTPVGAEERSSTGSDVSGSRTERLVQMLPTTVPGAFVEVGENDLRCKAMNGSRWSLLWEFYGFRGSCSENIKKCQQVVLSYFSAASGIQTNYM